MVNKPTRFDSNSNRYQPSLLDHIWINFVTPYSSGILLADISDHCPTFLNLSGLNTKSNNFSASKIEFNSYTKSSVDFFLYELSLINWNNILVGDVNDMMNAYESVVNELYMKIFPLKTKFLGNKRINKPWISSSIMQIIKNKSKYFKLNKLGLISDESYKNYRNSVNSIIRRAKINYYSNIFNSNPNPKKTWSTIKNILGHGKKTIIVKN